MNEETKPVALIEAGYGSVYESTSKGRVRHLLTVQGLHDAVRSIPKLGEQTATIDVAHYVALKILESLFGRAWVLQHALPSGRGDTAFLRTNATDDEGYNLHLLRLIGLAEMLFNFQRKPGLEGPLGNLRGGQIETAFAELEVAKLLSQYDIGFRFVTPEGCTGGKNHDLEFFHPNGDLCAGETKCKVETTDLTDATITSTLNYARKQLPEDGAGVIFLKVPQVWMETEGFLDRFSPLARRVFGNSKRVVAIIAYSSIVRHIESTSEITAGLIGREVRSHTRRDGKDWRMLTLYDDKPILPRGWVNLSSLFPQQ